MTIKISKYEKRKYVLSTKKDLKILNKIHEVEKIRNLNKDEKFLLKLIRTQLEHDWRTPLMKTLDKILKRRR